jgi:hypothetical protein
VEWGIFTRFLVMVFGVHLQTSFCGFGDFLYGKISCWDFDFQVSEKFVALILWVHF